MTYRPSIEERIAWTAGLRPTEKQVLQALAKFGDHHTGTNCHARIDTLVAWSELSRATVVRALRSLRDDGWIDGTHRHRRATNYRIDVERLATTPTRAKVVEQPVMIDTPTYKSEAQIEPQNTLILEAQIEPQERDQRLNLSLNDRSEAQIEPPPLYVRTTYPVVRADPSAPPLRVGIQETPEPATTTTETAIVHPQAKVEETHAPPPTGSADLFADRRDHQGRETPARGCGSDVGGGDRETPACGVGVSVRDRPNSPGALSGAPRPGAGPALWQPTMGPLDVSADTERKFTQLGRLAEVFRTALHIPARRGGKTA